MIDMKDETGYYLHMITTFRLQECYAFFVVFFYMLKPIE